MISYQRKKVSKTFFRSSTYKSNYIIYHRPLNRRSAFIINYYNFYADGVIDVMLMSMQAGDRKGGAVDVFRQYQHGHEHVQINCTADR